MIVPALSTSNTSYKEKKTDGYSTFYNSNKNEVLDTTTIEGTYDISLLHYLWNYF